jgi:hypothetical protein
MNQSDNSNEPAVSPLAELRKKANRYPGRFLLLYIGVAFVCGACWNVAGVIDMRQHGLRTLGVVVDIVQKSAWDDLARPSGSGVARVPVIRFSDNHGVEYKFVECCAEQPVPMGTRFFVKDDAVEVIYRPEDPAHTAQVFIGPWDLVIDGVIFAAGIVMLAQWVYLLKSPFKRLRSRRPREKKQ